MLFIVTGAVFLLLVVSFVKMLEKLNIRPYLVAYTLVILAGVYGAVGLAEFFIPMMIANPVEAGVNGALFMTGLGVMVWGLNKLKLLQEA